MRPILPPSLLLNGSEQGSQPKPLAATCSVEDELQHRKPHLVWASRESLSTPVPTLGTALIQHGLKEWLGADGGTQLVSLQKSGLGRLNGIEMACTELLTVLDDCQQDYLMPVVVCEEAQLASQCLSALTVRRNAILMAVGSPYTSATGCAELGTPEYRFPLRLDAAPASYACIWLGAPDNTTPAFEAPFGGLRVERRNIQPRLIGHLLEQAQRQAYCAGPELLACVLFLDDLNLSGLTAAGLPPELFAAGLRWLQSLVLVSNVVVFLVSHERITVKQRPAGQRPEEWCKSSAGRQEA